MIKLFIVACINGGLPNSCVIDIEGVADCARPELQRLFVGDGSNLNSVAVSGAMQIGTECTLMFILSGYTEELDLCDATISTLLELKETAVDDYTVVDEADSTSKFTISYGTLEVTWPREVV